MRLFKCNGSDVDMESITPRRTFLKKTVYAAPTLMVLGGLAKPTRSRADFGAPPSDPDTSVSASQSSSGDFSESSDFDTGNESDVFEKTLDSGL